jgi:sugar O-acyltransferase (sialic acid O-acetyltransferase NeuD family)
MLKKVAIIGGGKGAAVAAALLRESHEIIGYTDFSPSRYMTDYPYLGRDDVVENMDCRMIISIGKPKLRKTLYDRFCKGRVLVNAIHGSTIITQDAKIGKGNIVGAGNVLFSHSTIGNNNWIGINSCIGHHCSVGHHCVISSGISLAGNISIGNMTLIGVGASIAPDLKIGDNCVVGAGTVVLKDVPDNSTIVGNPGRIK